MNFTQNAPFGPKIAFSRKSHFWAKKLKFSGKVHFSQKIISCLRGTSEPPKYHWLQDQSRPGAQKRSILLHFRISEQNGAILLKIAFFRKIPRFCDFPHLSGPPPQNLHNPKLFQWFRGVKIARGRLLGEKVGISLNYAKFTVFGAFLRKFGPGDGVGSFLADVRVRALKSPRGGGAFTKK